MTTQPVKGGASGGVSGANGRGGRHRQPRTPGLPRHALTLLLVEPLNPAQMVWLVRGYWAARALMSGWTSPGTRPVRRGDRRISRLCELRTTVAPLGAFGRHLPRQSSFELPLRVDYLLAILRHIDIPATRTVTRLCTPLAPVPHRNAGSLCGRSPATDWCSGSKQTWSFARNKSLLTHTAPD